MLGLTAPENGVMLVWMPMAYKQRKSHDSLEDLPLAHALPYGIAHVMHPCKHVGVRRHAHACAHVHWRKSQNLIQHQLRQK